MSKAAFKLLIKVKRCCGYVYTTSNKGTEMLCENVDMYLYQSKATKRQRLFEQHQLEKT